MTLISERDLTAPAAGSVAGTSRSQPHRVPTGPPAQPRDAHRRRFTEIDILRFVAAAAVVGYHFFFRATATSPYLADTGFHDPGGVFRYGYLGVDLFFVISGFVILTSAWGKSPSGFLISRFTRLYPAFWVACTLTALVLVLVPGDRFSVRPAQYLANLTMAAQPLGYGYVDGVYWTLLIELKFYLLIFVLCLVGITRRRVLGFAIAWTTVSLLADVLPLPGALHQLLIPEWSPYFVAGVVFSLVAREGWSRLYLLLLAVSLGHAVFRALDFAGGLADKLHATFSPLVVVTVTAGIFAIFAVIASRRLETRWSRRLAAVGALTYPLYLVHQNIGYVIFHLGHGLVPRFALLGVVLIVAVVLAYALHTGVERRYAKSLSRSLTDWWAEVRSPAVGQSPDDIRRPPQLTVADRVGTEHLASRTNRFAA